MAELAGLIFDVDGTLAETERDGHRVAYNRAFAAAGLDWHWSESLYGELLAVAGGRERMRRFVAGYAPALPAGRSLDTLIEDLYAAKTVLFAELVARHGLPARPGIARLLAQARDRGLRLAIATTTSPRNVEALLASLLPDIPFEVIGAGEMVPRKKPAPDIYELVLRELDLPPAACLAFEDSDNGLLSARAAGIETVVTVSDYHRHQSFDGALLTVDHLGDPGQPCRVIAARVDVDAPAMIDVDVLRRAHAAAR